MHFSLICCYIILNFICGPHPCSLLELHKSLISELYIRKGQQKQMVEIGRRIKILMTLLRGVPCLLEKVYYDGRVCILDLNSRVCDKLWLQIYVLVLRKSSDIGEYLGWYVMDYNFFISCCATQTTEKNIYLIIYLFIYTVQSKMNIALACHEISPPGPRNSVTN